MKKGFEEEIKKSYIINQTNLIVDNFMAYYRYCDITEFYFDHIVNEASDEVVLTDKEKELLKLNVKRLLEDGYDIEIISDNPIKIREKDIVVW